MGYVSLQEGNPRFIQTTFLGYHPRNAVNAPAHWNCDMINLRNLRGSPLKTPIFFVAKIAEEKSLRENEY